MNSREKEELKRKFESLYQGKRLLSIQLNGFTNLVFYDDGCKESKVQIDGYSAYAPELDWSKEAEELLGKFPHYLYQNNAQEIVYVYPNER